MLKKYAYQLYAAQKNAQKNMLKKYALLKYS